MKKPRDLLMPSMKITGAIKCPNGDLQLSKTLMGGQCFRWKQLEDKGVGESHSVVRWRGVLGDHVWTLSHANDHLVYEVVTAAVHKENPNKKQQAVDSKCSPKDNRYFDDLLRTYFRLDENLSELYSLWASRDPCFEKSAMQFFGIRMLQQEPVENIFSFICSSNNNISRITSMVEKLCTFYGKELAEVDGMKYYSFPPASALANNGVEEKLRKEGFGYRAKYLHMSAKKIEAGGGGEWLERLQSLPYAEAKQQLMALPGVGAKVADCICLMSLGHLEAIPVDTHVFQISQRYLPHLKACKTVTDKVYGEISSYFQNLYGKYAGWAHSVLFCADLRQFQASPKSSSSVNGEGANGTAKKKPKLK